MEKAPILRIIDEDGTELSSDDFSEEFLFELTTAQIREEIEREEWQNWEARH